mmetsp:Transcript_89199/g.260783  ORF Transcript_89199/g.260783 Transcript_89199/m.260783 type:complete len:206 (-) Transcript_89199:426-1043(-)
MDTAPQRAKAIGWISRLCKVEKAPRSASCFFAGGGAAGRGRWRLRSTSRLARKAWFLSRLRRSMLHSPTVGSSSSWKAKKRRVARSLPTVRSTFRICSSKFMNSSAAPANCSVHSCCVGPPPSREPLEDRSAASGPPCRWSVVIRLSLSSRRLYLKTSSEIVGEIWGKPPDMPRLPCAVGSRERSGLESAGARKKPSLQPRKASW